MYWRTILIIIGFIILGGAISYYFSLSLWFRALLSGIWINPFRFIRLRLQEVDPELIVLPLITSFQAGLNIPIARLESHHLAKGNVEKVLKALTIARKAGVPIDFGKASAIDLAGFDVVQSVQNYVTPKVIKTPKVTAVAKDGIQLTIMARITVQTSFDQIVGGAGEETVLGMAGEDIVATVGSSESHKDVQAHPDLISNKILNRLQETERSKILAYKVMAVDIESIDIGKNIGAEQRVKNAEAEKKISQANAEKKEHEVRVKILEKKAQLLDAEAQVPMAIAAAIREGKVDLKEYYRMKNIIADTRMRNSMASSDMLSEILSEQDDESRQSNHHDQKQDR